MKKVTFNVLAIILFMMMFSPLCYGQETGSPISVSPVYPENQAAGHRGYYHMEVEPGEEQTVYIDIENYSDEEVYTEIVPVDSFTGPAGGITYEEEMDKEVSRLLYPDLALANFISTDGEVIIPPKSVERVSFTISVPDIAGGQFIGAIRVSAILPEDDSEEGLETDHANVVIKNRISFTTAVQLDLPQDAEPGFSFGEVNVRTQPGNRNLLIEMINDAQMILRGTTGTYRVEYNDEELFSGEWEEFTMVPNSAFYFPVLWESERVDPGEYTVFLTANVLGGKIEEIRTFTIEREESREHERHLAEHNEEVLYGTNLPWWVWAIGGVVVAGSFYWLGARRK